MVWNPSPEVADARMLGKKWDADQVVILLVNTETGRIRGISYGTTKALCAEAETLLNQAWEAIVKA